MPKGDVTSHHPCLGSKFPYVETSLRMKRNKKISDDKPLKVVNPFPFVHNDDANIHPERDNNLQGRAIQFFFIYTLLAFIKSLFLLCNYSQVT